ncbi:MAG: hypothetical protein ABIF19_21330 [Planctomycetota bacterium]
MAGNIHRCPREEQGFLKPQDIFEVQCPGCGRIAEFFRDDAKQKCHKCGQVIVNPRCQDGG